MARSALRLERRARLRNALSSCPGANDTVVDGGMTIGAPVCGLRPVRPFLRFLVNVPKPG